MANATEMLALQVGDEVAKTLDISVIGAQFLKEAGKQYLRIFIDKKDGIGIDECEAFSRAFEKKFDEIDPIKTEYTLEVSSPGLDRKLKTKREFDYFKGREVDVKLYKAEDGKKEFCGILVGFDGETAEIQTDSENKFINVKEAAYIKLHFEF